MNLSDEIQAYIPYNEQEKTDQRNMLLFLSKYSDVLTRDNQIAHFTASAWVVNNKKNRVLMVYHNLYQSWSWTGGHADGEENLLSVAVRETKEETGITKVQALSEKPFSLEILHVEGHEKNNAYVPCHLHLNVTYLLEADEKELLKVKPDENSGVKWFGLKEALLACSEPFVAERIYKKLNEKLIRNSLS